LSSHNTGARDFLARVGFLPVRFGFDLDDLRLALLAIKMRLNVEIGDFQRVLLDKITPWLDVIAHQRFEYRARLIGLRNPHLQERAGFDIERGFP
jgi:hypothetical protein